MILMMIIHLEMLVVQVQIECMEMSKLTFSFERIIFFIRIKIDYII